MLKKGSNVSWNWGNGTAKGKIEEVHKEEFSKTIKGSKITKKGTNDNPAYLIKQDDGSKVIKLKSELNES